MTRALLRLGMLMILLACTLPAFAQTRAWLDRAQITYGETATLNIQTDASVQQIDYRPLSAQFDIAGQTVRRSFQRVNGQNSTRSLFAVGIRPRGPGVLTVPALRVGNATTAPLRLTVVPPSVVPASGNADAFVETVVDAAQPYVQQAVGMVVRLHVGVNLLSGQLDQEPPPGASLQRVGEDLQYQREIQGRRYSVIERRYLLIPERSGPLLIPGARFNGQAVGGFFDDLFGDGRKPLSAAAQAKRLQVQPIPANAPQPWLPLHDLRLRYVQAPKQARAGAATTVELEMIADGATATQLPALTFPQSTDVQVFAEPAQSDEQFIDGRPRATLRRRISIVPLHPGTLSLPGPRIEWWDAAQGVARTAMLPPLQLQVAPGAVADNTTASNAPHGDASDAVDVVGSKPGVLQQILPWLGLMAVLLALTVGWWLSKRRHVAIDVAVEPAVSETDALPSAVSSAPSLADALKRGDLPGIAHALCRSAGVQGDDLDALHAKLDDPAQTGAVEQMQAARWGAGDVVATLAALRAAFGKGVRLRRQASKEAPLLPPLYPEN
ncbi:MAG: BatD family protein [Thermomonas sp.]